MLQALKLVMMRLVHCVNEGVQTDLAGSTATGGVYSGASYRSETVLPSFDPAAAGVGVHN
jgi:hypothetical protein